MDQPESLYPIQFDVDYPEEPLNRLTTFFRLIVVIPIAIVLSLISGGAINFDDFALSGGAVAGGLFFALLLMIMFRRKYPRWWFDWNLALMKFSSRVSAFFTLLRDEFPSTDEEQAVHLEFPYPNAETELNRWLPLVKWLLAIPHYIVLVILGILAFFAVVFSWFAILFTGRYPVGLFSFVVGVMRWSNRVTGYAFLLVTDRYPPFSLR